MEKLCENTQSCWLDEGQILVWESTTCASMSSPLLSSILRNAANLRVIGIVGAELREKGWSKILSLAAGHV